MTSGMVDGNRRCEQGNGTSSSFRFSNDVETNIGDDDINTEFKKMVEPDKSSTSLLQSIHGDLGCCNGVLVSCLPVLLIQVDSPASPTEEADHCQENIDWLVGAAVEVVNTVQPDAGTPDFHGGIDGDIHSSKLEPIQEDESSYYDEVQRAPVPVLLVQVGSPASTAGDANAVMTNDCPADVEQSFVNEEADNNAIQPEAGEMPKNSGKHVCTSCHQTFLTEASLHLHTVTHMQTAEVKKHKCSHCPYSSSRKGNLNAHMRVHTGERPHKCDYCGKTFTQLSDCRKHMRVHTKECPYECNICNKAFARSSSRRKHMRIHTGERPYKCSVCNKAFALAGNCKKHMKIHTREHPRPSARPPAEDCPYKCLTCGKAFAAFLNYQRHLKIHTGDLPWKCTTCGKGFVFFSACQKHMRTHTGERPYKCTSCGKGFTQLTACQIHMRIHTGERPYKCTTCGKAFTHPTTCQIHLRIHTGERPYKCATCAKSFSTSSACQKHARLHLRENARRNMNDKD